MVKQICYDLLLNTGLFSAGFSFQNGPYVSREQHSTAIKQQPNDTSNQEHDNIRMCAVQMRAVQRAGAAVGEEASTVRAHSPCSHTGTISVGLHKL